MKTHAKVLAIIFLTAGLLGISAWNVHGQANSTCSIIQQALSDYAHIKVGITRGEVEKYFAKGGGAQFPDSTRYVHPKCGYIHLDVEFTVNGPVEHLFSPDDKAVKVSKLYVEYPAKD